MAAAFPIGQKTASKAGEILRTSGGTPMLHMPRRM